MDGRMGGHNIVSIERSIDRLVDRSIDGSIDP